MLNSLIIEDYLKNNKISKTKFCKICKISPETLKKILNNQKDINKISLFRVARIVNVEISTFIN